MKDRNPWTTLGSVPKYSNPWIEVVEHQVVKPDGGPGIYGTVHFKNLAIGILPLADNGDTWLVGQFRYPLGRYSWEIPEGGGLCHVDPLETAKRELEEEAGLQAARWDLILEMDLSNSVTNERSYSYLARDLKEVPSHPDDDEVLEIQRLPLRKAVQMVLDGEIRDALAVATILRAARLLQV